MSVPRPHTALRTRRGRAAVVAIALAGLTLPVAGCGGGTSTDAAGQAGGATGAPATAKKVTEIAAAVPASIRKKGTLTVVMSTSSPPAHFESDGGTMKGLDPELAVLVGKVLGLRTKVQGVPLDQIIPGLQAKRYDVVLSQFSPTPERAKVVDFVDYAKSGTRLGVAGGNPKKLSMKALCGVRVGVQKGSSQTVDVVPSLNRACRGKGDKPVSMMTFRDSSSALLALRSSRVDGVLLDSPVLGYAVKQSHGKVAAAGTVDANPVAVGVVKDSGLDKPVQKALQYLKRSGAYDKLFARWGLQGTALKAGEFRINDIKGE